MTVLGNGLSSAKHHEDALSVREAELATKRRLGAPEENILVVQGNLACTYEQLGRREDALRMRQEVYSVHLKLNGEEHHETMREALNYALTLLGANRFEEAKVLMRKTLPVAQRVFGESYHLTLRIRFAYSMALYQDDCATLDEVREAVNTLEEAERTARRVLGGAHPLVEQIELGLPEARAALRAREAPSTSAP